MNKSEVLQILSSCQKQLETEFGVTSLSLFGSVARDEATETSDVDVLVEFSRPTGYFGLIALQNRLETLLHCKVDVGTPQSLKPRLRARVLEELVHVG